MIPLNFMPLPHVPSHHSGSGLCYCCTFHLADILVYQSLLLGIIVRCLLKLSLALVFFFSYSWFIWWENSDVLKLCQFICAELVYAVNNYILITLLSSFPKPAVRFTRLYNHTGILLHMSEIFFFPFWFSVKIIHFKETLQMLLSV